MSHDLPPGVTGVLALADGTILPGLGCGAVGEAVGEVCFNTAMAGYQEILTDPSYMAQIVAFTFPHIGNVGTNSEDLEQISGSSATAARGAIFVESEQDVPEGAICVLSAHGVAPARRVRHHKRQCLSPFRSQSQA